MVCVGIIFISMYLKVRRVGFGLQINGLGLSIMQLYPLRK